MTSKKTYLFIIFILLSAFFIYSLNVQNLYFNSPDEAITKLFSGIYGKTGKMYYEPNDYYFDIISRIRGTYIYENKIVPLKFIGYPYLFGSTTTFVPDLLPYITPILAAILILVIFLMSNEIFDDIRIAYFSAAILIFLPFFWYWANHPFFDNVSSLFFFFMGYFYLIKISKGNHNINYFVLVGIFYGLSFAIRYDSGIIMLATSLPFIFELRKIKIGKMLTSLFFFFIVLSPILIIRSEIYGGYFMYGQRILSSSEETIPRFFDNVVQNYIWVGVFFQLIILAIVGMFIEIKGTNNLNKKIVLGIIIFIVLFSYIYLSEFAPKHPNALHESFTRYSLGFYIFASIFIGRLFTIWHSKTALLMFLVFLVLSFSVAFPIIDWQWKSAEKNENLVKKIQENTQENSYILVAGEDKYLYPSRKAIPINNYKDNESGEINYSRLSQDLWEINKRFPVYIYAQYLDLDKISQETSKIGLKIIPENKTIYLYEVRR